MDILLPIANIEVNVLFILVLGFFVGVLSGMIGIGGGIILNPVLIKLGIPSIIVVGTSISQMIGASLSGFLSYLRSGTVDLKMGKYILWFSFIGGFLGVLLINVLKSTGDVKSFILMVYVIYLILVGSFIFYESFQNKKDDKCCRFYDKFKHLPFQTDFQVGKVSIIIPASIGFISGFLASIMGIGGGNLVVPALMYLAGYNIVSAVSISVFQMVFVTSFLTFLHSYINHGVDIVLGLLLLIGSSFGAVFGSLIGQRIDKFYLKMLLSFLMILVAIFSLYQLLTNKEKEVFIIKPTNFLSTLILQNTFLYSVLVVVLSLLLGYIISMVALRLRRLFTK